MMYKYGGLFMIALIAFIPILTTLVLMLVMNWPAKWCLLISFLLSINV